MFSWIFRYMPSSTRSNKESQLIFSPDPASLERTIRKEARYLSTDNNTSVSLDSAQPPSTQTPVPSTDSRSPLSIDKIDLPSTENLHPTSIDIPSRTLIDTEPREMVAPLILVRDNNGDLHDQEGHLRNAAGIIAACHCGDEYETEYSESIETHTATSIDSSNQISHEESVDTHPDEWENYYFNPTIDAYTRQNMHTNEYDEDYEEEQAIEYRAILDEEDKLLHHSSCTRTAPSIDRTSLPSIDTQPQQRC
ncbi:hypothetical protein DY000_02060043 [Brassica cretica]|uniref:Uncharacterized protein n=1 Tax=Brassica cretica TaxID=69181 RepID=A0ABQ7AQF0_BRACR|nr:hypothetical protein DY000_02060043 [Brassica cretica]